MLPGYMDSGLDFFLWIASETPYLVHCTEHGELDRVGRWQNDPEENDREISALLFATRVHFRHDQRPFTLLTLVT